MNCAYVPCSKEFQPRRTGRPQRLCSPHPKPRRVVAMMTRTCANPSCGTTFETVFAKKRCCSQRCARASRLARVDRVRCDVCHTPFEPTPRQLRRWKRLTRGHFCKTCTGTPAVMLWKRKNRRETPILTIEQRLELKASRAAAEAERIATLCPRCFISKDAVGRKDGPQCWAPSCPLRIEQISDDELEYQAGLFAKFAGSLSRPAEDWTLGDGNRRYGARP